MKKSPDQILENSKLSNYVCPTHKQFLNDQCEDGQNILACDCDCSFPIIRGIPRFVSGDRYVTSFGLQWNKYRTTQLDSHTGLTISRDRLTRLLGGSLDVVNGKKILEAGCGAGRFSEILLEAGAHLCAVDLSTAVDANYQNCSKFPNYSVCQASILELPFPPEQFDLVICIGVIQHTPNPEQTMTALCRQLKPGGLLVIDHYSHNYPATTSRRLLRALLLRLPEEMRIPICNTLTFFLWPLHRLFWRGNNLPFFGRLRHFFLRLSPLVDYHDAYPQLGPHFLKRWATLDTHDTLTDHYKHFRSADEIRNHLQQCGMINIEAYYAGNGVEARAWKQLRNE